MKNLIQLSVIGVAAFTASSASAAYVCELYDRAANAPGGEIPAAIYYSNTTDFALAKKACSGKVDRQNFIDYWLKWTTEDKLPTDWKEHDLLAGSSTPTVPPVVEPATKPGYACIVYDKPAHVPNGNVPFQVFYSDVLKLEVVQPACISKMREVLPNQYRDYQVKWLESLPEGWADQRLM